VKPWKAIAAALALFVAGVLCGVMTEQLVAHHNNRRKPITPDLVGPLGQRVAMMRRLENRLDLTPEQRTRIEVLIRESQQRLRDMWDPIAPRAEEELRHLHHGIELELTPPQRAQFKTLLSQPAHSPRTPGSSRPPGSGHRSAAGTNAPHAPTGPTNSEPVARTNAPTDPRPTNGTAP
jgi:Spy/CpxP family protein refolding chaperone